MTAHTDKNLHNNNAIVNFRIQVCSELYRFINEKLKKKKVIIEISWLLLL